MKKVKVWGETGWQTVIDASGSIYTPGSIPTHVDNERSDNATYRVHTFEGTYEGTVHTYIYNTNTTYLFI